MSQPSATKPPKGNKSNANLGIGVAENPTTRTKTQGSGQLQITTPPTGGSNALNIVPGPSWLSEMEKHKEFYYNDGTIIFVANHYSTGPRCMFRVYRGLVEKHSPKLKKLVAEAFEITQDRRLGWYGFEGCPVVLMKESTKEMETLFEVLWGGFYADVGRRSSEFVITALRLATKWEMVQVREWCFKVLAEKIPTMYEKRLVVSSWTEWITPSQVLQLHREFDLPQLAAMACYHLSTISWNEQPIPISSCLPLPLSSGEEALEGLRVVDARNILTGRERIQSQCLEFFYQNQTLAKLESSPCQNVARGSRKCLSSELKRGELGGRCLSTLLRFPLVWAHIFWVEWEANFCTGCKSDVDQAGEMFGRKIFNELATLFGVSETPRQLGRPGN